MGCRPPQRGCAAPTRHPPPRRPHPTTDDPTIMPFLCSTARGRHDGSRAARSSTRACEPQRRRLRQRFCWPPASCSCIAVSAEAVSASLRRAWPSLNIFWTSTRHAARVLPRRFRMVTRSLCCTRWRPKRNANAWLDRRHRWLLNNVFLLQRILHGSGGACQRPREGCVSPLTRPWMRLRGICATAS